MGSTILRAIEGLMAINQHKIRASDPFPMDISQGEITFVSLQGTDGIASMQEPIATLATSTIQRVTADDASVSGTHGRSLTICHWTTVPPPHAHQKIMEERFSSSAALTEGHDLGSSHPVPTGKGSVVGRMTTSFVARD